MNIDSAVEAIVTDLVDAFVLATEGEGIPPEVASAVVATVTDAVTNHFEELTAHLAFGDTAIANIVGVTRHGLHDYVTEIRQDEKWEVPNLRARRPRGVR